MHGVSRRRHCVYLRIQLGDGIGIDRWLASQPLQGFELAGAPSLIRCGQVRRYTQDPRESLTLARIE
jgi:hypothetical protein